MDSNNGLEAKISRIRHSGDMVLNSALDQGLQASWHYTPATSKARETFQLGLAQWLQWNKIDPSYAVRFTDDPQALKGFIYTLLVNDRVSTKFKAMLPLNDAASDNSYLEKIIDSYKNTQKTNNTTKPLNVQYDINKSFLAGNKLAEEFLRKETIDITKRSLCAFSGIDTADLSDEDSKYYWKIYNRIITDLDSKSADYISDGITLEENQKTNMLEMIIKGHHQQAIEACDYNIYLLCHLMKELEKEDIFNTNTRCNDGSLDAELSYIMSMRAEVDIAKDNKILDLKLRERILSEFEQYEDAAGVRDERKKLEQESGLNDFSPELIKGRGLTINELIRMAQTNDYIFPEIMPAIEDIEVNGESLEKIALEKGGEGDYNYKPGKDKEKRAYMIGIMRWIYENEIEEIYLAPVLAEDSVTLKVFTYVMNEKGWKFIKAKKDISSEEIETLQNEDSQSYNQGYAHAKSCIEKGIIRMTEMITDFSGMEVRSYPIERIWELYGITNELSFDVDSIDDITERVEVVENLLACNEDAMNEFLVEGSHDDALNALDYKIFVLHYLDKSMKEYLEENGSDYEYPNLTANSQFLNNLHMNIDGAVRYRDEIKRMKNNPDYDLHQREIIASRAGQFELASQLRNARIFGDKKTDYTTERKKVKEK